MNYLSNQRAITLFALLSLIYTINVPCYYTCTHNSQVHDNADTNTTYSAFMCCIHLNMPIYEGVQVRSWVLYLRTSISDR